MRKPTLLYLEETIAGPPAGTLLVKAEDIPVHGGKDLLFKDGEHQTNIFVQRDENIFHVYENRCPHAGTPLNMFGDSFLSLDKAYILCRTHGALFDKKNGKCVRGPCKGDYLRAVAFEVRDDGLYSL